MDLQNENIDFLESRRAFGMCLGITRDIELYFDFMKSEYIKKLYKLTDCDLVEDVKDALDSSRERSPQSFERILKCIENAYTEQKHREMRREVDNRILE